MSKFYRAEHDAGRLANAQLNYSRAIKLNPDDWEAHYNLGQVYAQLQDLDRARASYQAKFHQNASACCLLQIFGAN
ncbi:MAG: tetratricopeptide repeat protein [Cyanomargarita calcarea GSE-NOS-MK-12-04C]|uniref:Tetratricopeptide repeat protein n=1 Tax=Cyanomargarita calcarea GSE-NOS-MK-12-04C TaxID=2839659 RepID=A0A951UVQ3_9CYAN|nr:tetratricopeptide repeat protein [Cyanomargarita calcarea GSE-NOS-MK-12-04C]